MKQERTMDVVQMKAMRATIRDGISEMFLGFVLLVFGVLFYFATPLAAFGALFPVALNPLGRFLKRRFVYPRIGYSKAIQKQHATRGILVVAVLAIAFLLGSLGVFAWIKGFDRGYALWLSYFVPATGGFLMAIGPWVVARTYRLLRWYVFAALFAAGGICLPIFHVATGYEAISLESAIVGALSLVYGIFLFVTFLAKYPMEEVEHAAQGE